jgi:hypothetical protein
MYLRLVTDILGCQVASNDPDDVVSVQHADALGVDLGVDLLMNDSRHT